MMARIRKTILLAAASVALAVYASLLIADTLDQHRTRQRQIDQEIAKVSSKETPYNRVWEKLVEEHGSQDAALDALRVWAESMIDYREAKTRWKRGHGTRPKSPEALAHFSESEEEQLKEVGGVPYGCSVTYANGFRCIVSAFQ